VRCDDGRVTTSAAFWDAQAATFDAEPDHGLASPVVRAAWAARLRERIPDDGVDVLDVGCGTGSLALVLAEQGHTVTGVDLSPNMVELARRKLAGRATILLGDAAVPPVGDRRFDVVLCRHLLWALPDPAAALRRWTGLLRPGGQLVLIEGRWGAEPAAGLSADVLTATARPFVARSHVEHLTASVLWGREITDERYALLAHV
jgi:ubiquinone/menaquinone biosynthesis C-methylase UbiE